MLAQRVRLWGEMFAQEVARACETLAYRVVVF